jgi:HD-like signal output (HDOD) protein
MCQLYPATERFFKDANHLPAMPEVAQRLLATFRRDDVGLPELATLIGSDQALSARLLRLANSARYSPARGGGDRVLRLSDATALIGLAALRSLAMGACLANVFPNPQGFDRVRFWCQNLATAGHARWLAELLGEDPDTAEMAGLMLRSGELLMLLAEPGLTALVEDMAGLPDSVFEVERLNFGCTHAEVSAELAVRWRFPAEMVDALFTAADPLAAQPFSRMGALLRCASVLADAGCAGLDPLAELAQHQNELVQRLGLDLAALAGCLPVWTRLTATVSDLLG